MNNFGKIRLRAVLAALLLAALAAPASAQNEEELWDRCLRQDKTGPMEPDEVIAACRAVLRMDYMPANVRNDAFNNIGVAYTRQGKTDDALRMFNEALRFVRTLPDSPAVRQLSNYTRRNRADTYVQTKQYDEALEDYDIMASREPIPKYLGLRCMAHALWDEKFASALTDCQKAIDADKSAGEAYAGWLIVEYRQGKYADVKADCKLSGTQIVFTPNAMAVCALAEMRVGDPVQGKNFLALAQANGEQVTARFKELGIE